MVALPKVEQNYVLGSPLDWAGQYINDKTIIVQIKNILL
jgi:hypothetical protein